MLLSLCTKTNTHLYCSSTDCLRDVVGPEPAFRQSPLILAGAAIVTEILFCFSLERLRSDLVTLRVVFCHLSVISGFEPISFGLCCFYFFFCGCVFITVIPSPDIGRA